MKEFMKRLGILVIVILFFLTLVSFIFLNRINLNNSSKYSILANKMHASQFGILTSKNKDFAEEYIVKDYPDVRIFASENSLFLVCDPMEENGVHVYYRKAFLNEPVGKPIYITNSLNYLIVEKDEKEKIVVSLHESTDSEKVEIFPFTELSDSEKLLPLIPTPDD